MQAARKHAAIIKMRGRSNYSQPAEVSRLFDPAPDRYPAH
jgi:hypothetical protein